MQHNRFANICLGLIVGLLGVIAFRHETTSAYAAKKVSSDVIRVDESNRFAYVPTLGSDGARCDCNYIIPSSTPRRRRAAVPGAGETVALKVTAP